MAIQTELIGVGSRGNEVRYPTPHSGLERLNLFMENKFEFMPRLLARIALTRQYSSPHAYSYGVQLRIVNCELPLCGLTPMDI